MRKFILPGIIVFLVLIFVFILLGYLDIEPFNKPLNNTFRSIDKNIPIVGIAEAEEFSVETRMVNQRPEYYLNVVLVPTSSALENYEYEVQLYEKGENRDSTTVTWNQPEINVSKSKKVSFEITPEEYKAYHGEDISKIFKIFIQE
jgi:hypothetical protein